MNRRACYSLALLAWSRPSLSTAFILQHPSSSSISNRLTTPQQNLPAAFFFSSSTMSASSTEVVDVAANLQSVRDQIQKACEEANRPADSVRLVAVSKTKPVELLRQAYDAGNRIFGENYAQELVEKVPQLPDDVQWHFIGGLQSNKANMLVKAFGEEPNRLTVETVDKFKLANKLNNAVQGDNKKLRVFVQVNTSGEETKSGCEPSDCVELCQRIVKECDKLELRGLMTIGAPGDLSCFDVLDSCRQQVAEALDRNDLELSMGMSGDYTQAIAAGATNVRVGSTIFGARDYSSK